MAVNEFDTLIAQFKQGDIKSFDELYFQYYKSVLKNIYVFVRNQEDAKEIAQDVFVSLWNKRETLEASRSIGGWLMVVSKNKALNFLQKHIRGKLVNATEMLEDVDAIKEDQPDQTTDIDTQLVYLENAIKTLPPKQQQAFTLCKLQSMTYAQASQRLGISPHTVREYVSNAMAKIKNELLAISPDVIFVLLLLLAIV